MMSAQKNQPSWAEIVKGQKKGASAQPVETKLQLNPEVQEFKFNPEVQEFQFNPQVQEFKPQVNQSLNPCATDFDPQLMEKAAQMTSLLLDCYSDSDDDDDDKENRGLHVVAAPVTASKVVACAQLNPLAKTFSPPVTRSLDASAKEFDPQLMQRAAQMTKVLLQCDSDSDEEDDDDHSEPHGRRALATPATSAKVSACAQLNPSAKVFSPPAGDVKLLPAVAFRPPPGLTLPDVVQMNMDCYSSDDESPCAPGPARARKRVSKLDAGSDGDSDSTSAGNSDTESLRM